MSKHTELEYKFAADHLYRDEFRQTMLEANPTGFENYQHDDVFYGYHGAEGEVLRHRIKGLEGAGELTVKKRKSQETLVERVEINLKFAPKMTFNDVDAFVKAIGYQKLFMLRKSHVDVFDFRRQQHKIEVAFYTVGKVTPAGLVNERKFLEVEIKPISDPNPLLTLGYWRDWLANNLRLEDPLNISLFEYYSRTGS